MTDNQKEAVVYSINFFINMKKLLKDSRPFASEIEQLRIDERMKKYDELIRELSSLVDRL